jgi:peptide-methionine (R)-S-oxide reductase
MEKIEKSEEEWQKILNPDVFWVTRKKGTEKPFSGQYWNCWEDGIYRCACCGSELFDSKTKFDAGCGWPSFYAPVAPENIATQEDRSWLMIRTEVLCAKCGAHLGHVFEDGPKPTGLRYCINSLALKLEKGKQKEV